MDQSLAELVRRGHVTPDAALERAFDRENFRSILAKGSGSPAPGAAPPRPPEDAK